MIGYASWRLNVSESHYPAHKLKFLALKWAVSDKFRDYLYGNRFTVFTDNNPLTYILTSAKHNATGHRWLAALSVFGFNIQYPSGHANIDPDTLSRQLNPAGVAADVVNAVC